MLFYCSSLFSASYLFSVNNSNCSLRTSSYFLVASWSFWECFYCYVFARSVISWMFFLDSVKKFSISFLSPKPIFCDLYSLIRWRKRVFYYFKLVIDILNNLSNTIFIWFKKDDLKLIWIFWIKFETINHYQMINKNMK